MEKKKILIIFTGAMELGGVERSLLGLLDAIDYLKYDVDLFLYGHHGPLFDLINEKVNLLPEVNELSYLRESLRQKIKHGCYYSAWRRMLDAVTRNKDYDNTWADIMRRTAPELACKYDLAISFFRPFDFLVEKVNAKVKIGWIHTDYTNAGEETEPLRADYARVDKIAAVSEECKDTFLSLFPEYREKLFVMENILSKSFIEEQSELIDITDEMPYDESIRLLSVGRFCHQKNFDNVPYICQRLKEYGLKIKWYLIGFGDGEALIRENIKKTGTENEVIILGKKDNPYPYMKGCDIYVQPSRYEGKAVTVREAQILAKPVVITRYATSGSQLRDGIDGIIVPMDNEGCAKDIAELIGDKSKQEELSKNCAYGDFSNGEEVGKIYRYLR